MNVITAIGNEKINKKMQEHTGINIIGNDIQYQEAVIEILEKNVNIDLLILSSILPGELNIFEFINLLIYKNPKIEIIIILEKENDKLKDFIISKGINNIYYNNEITFEEIFKKIYEIENNSKINKLENVIEKNQNNISLQIKNKIEYLKKIIINKMENKIINKNQKNNKKIISIIGGKKIGKSIFSLILSLNIKNKKILIINFIKEENNLKIIVGKKIKKEYQEKNMIINWKKNIDLMFISEEMFMEKNFKDKQIISNFFDKLQQKYSYIIVELNEVYNKEHIIKRSNDIIALVEANLLGINEIKGILNEIVNKQNNQKDKIKIVFNKYNITSIKPHILHKMFMDFEIIGIIQYDKFYNYFINSNASYISKKIKKIYTSIFNELNKKQENK